MTLRPRPLPALVLPLLLAACVPGSLKLGEDDNDTDTDPGTGSETGTSDAPSTGEPTTGEPVPEGVLERTQKIDGVTGLDMVIAGDGSIVVVGLADYTFNGGDGGVYASSWVGKFAPAGDLLWAIETPFPPDAAQSPIGVAVRPDGVIHVLDVDYATLAGGGNAVRRFSPDGELLGTTTLLLRPRTIAATASGVVVGGLLATEDTAVGWVAVLDDFALPIWQRTFEDPDAPFSVVDVVAVDGDELVFGGTRGQASAQTDAWLARATVADGTMIWERQITADATASESVHDLGIAGDGTILARVRGEQQDLVRAFDPAGADLWSHALTDVRGVSLAVAADGSFALTGALYPSPDDPDVCFEGEGLCPVAVQAVRHEPDRSPRWTATRDECSAGNVIAVTPNDGILVLAACGEPGLADVATGLMWFAP